MQKDFSLPRFWIKPYYRSFNGLRGVAVLMVFVHHYVGFIGAPRIVDSTWEGVDLFFVLSGFLITGILYDALGDRHFFRNFYVRRTLRIFPVFYGFFLLLLLFTPLLHLRYDWSMIAYVFYFGNLIVPFLDLARHNPTMISIAHHGHLVDVANLGHLWSLCVEEQFYLIWPSVVWLIRDRKRLMNLCLFLTVATVLGRSYLRCYATQTHIDQYLIYWSSYTRCDPLLIGSWMALWLRGTALSTVRLRRISSCLFWFSLIAIAIGMEVSPHSEDILQNKFVDTIGLTFIALACAGVLLRTLDDDSLLSRILRNRPLSFLGTVSYGFYVFHDLPIESWEHIAHLYPHLKPVIPLMAFGLTLGLAVLSFRYFEIPFLRLKKVLAPQQESEHGIPSRLHVSVPETQDIPTTP